MALETIEEPGYKPPVIQILAVFLCQRYTVNLDIQIDFGLKSIPVIAAVPVFRTIYHYEIFEIISFKQPELFIQLRYEYEDTGPGNTGLISTTTSKGL